MSDIIKRKFKCTGCGEDRPCYIETNQEQTGFDYMVIDDLKCVLDETNQTSYNWVEMQANGRPDNHEQALPIRDVSKRICPDALQCANTPGGCRCPENVQCPL